MREVRVYIESTWKGPARRDGVAMWLVECVRGGQAVTRQGFIHAEDGTETKGCLMAMINAICILKAPCSIRVYTGCNQILVATQFGWHENWKENGWLNAKGKPVKNAEVWAMLIDKAKPHRYSVEDTPNPYVLMMQEELRKEMERWRPKREKAS